MLICDIALINMDSIDSILINGLSLGDVHAFDALFHRYYGRILSFVRAITCDDFQSETITQEIFMKLWDNRRCLAEIKSFDSYLFVCSRNAALHSLNKKHLRTCDEEELHGLNSEELTPEEKLELQEIIVVIKQKIDSLPPQRKRVFTLSRMDGLSNKEISETLGISERTVENHISAVLKLLRRYNYHLALFVFNII